MDTDQYYSITVETEREVGEEEEMVVVVERNGTGSKSSWQRLDKSDNHAGPIREIPFAAIAVLNAAITAFAIFDRLSHRFQPQISTSDIQRNLVSVSQTLSSLEALYDPSNTNVHPLAGNQRSLPRDPS